MVDVEASRKSSEISLSGIVHAWFFSINQLPPPRELDSILLPQPAENIRAEIIPKTWFQGQIFCSASPAKQCTILGVPAHSPPHIHGCMVSDHDTPTFYDVYISEYRNSDESNGRNTEVKFVGYGVERNGGSGDAIELTLEPPTSMQMPPLSTAKVVDSRFTQAHHMSKMKLSTTRMMSGERAHMHLTKYAPDALQVYQRAGIPTSDKIVCLGAISVQ